MIVVGPLNNDNGMATWCWEAALALHRAGQPVILAASHSVKLPGDPGMEVIRLRDEEQPRSKGMRLLLKISKVIYPIALPKPDGTLKDLHGDLIRRGKQPTAYILNQTTMVDDSIPVPQFVVAWAYPISLNGYLAKTNVMLQSKHPLARPRMFLWILGNWREDWRAYRSATAVLAVTGTLCDALVKEGLRAFRVYPGMRTTEARPKPFEGTRRILMAAALLDEPRKRIQWMLDALAGVEGLENCELLLAGVPSASIEAAVKQLHFPAKLLGRLRRDELQTLMTECDILCFGSKMDDWGYVVAEAVSNGMIVVAPDQSPFDEIIGGTGFMFDPKSPTSFVDCLQNAVRLEPDAAYRLKENAKTHAANTFSNHVFAQVLTEVIESRVGA